MCKLTYNCCRHCHEIMGPNSDERQDPCGNMPDCNFRRLYLIPDCCEDCRINRGLNTDPDKADGTFPSCVEQWSTITSTEWCYS